MTAFKRLFAVMTACALLIALSLPARAEGYSVYTGRDNAKVYDASGKAVAALPANIKLQLTAMKGSVCKVSYRGRTGFMKKSDLARATSAEAEGKTDTGATRTSMTAYAAKDGAKVYNSKGKTIAKLSVNTEVTVTAVKGSACQVSANGRTGYMNKSDLSEKKVEVAETVLETTDASRSVSVTAYAAKDGAKVYNAKGKTIARLDLNAEVTVTAVKGSACQVSANGKTGYMNKSDLSETKVEAPEATPTAAPAIAATAYVAKDGAKVYNARGKAVGSLELNTQVTVTAVNGSLCRVSVAGRTGYMKQSDLAQNKVEAEQTLNRTAYVNRDGARVYNAKGKKVGTLGLNAEVTVVAVRGRLCKITSGGKTGFMRADDLSTSKTEVPSGVVDIPNTTGYVCTDGAKVYDKNGNAIAQLALNTAVTVSAYSDDLVQVVNGSVTGYMKKSDVSTSKVEGRTLKYGDSGEAVKKVQQRLTDLGYYSGTIGGNYQSMTQAAVAAFQAQAGLTPDGACDARTLAALFSDSAPKMSKNAGNGASTGVASTSAHSTATPAKGTAKEMDWWTSGIQKIFPRGATATVTDVDTGLAWREQRRGGTNHADVQPLTAADTAVLKQAYGGTWSWARRAIYVTIDGVNYAASMNGMPHGGGSITGNNFNGHHCIHFTNSRTHGSNKVCSLHQAAIKKAAGATL